MWALKAAAVRLSTLPTSILAIILLTTPSMPHIIWGIQQSNPEADSSLAVMAGTPQLEAHQVPFRLCPSCISAAHAEVEV